MAVLKKISADNSVTNDGMKAVTIAQIPNAVQPGCWSSFQMGSTVVWFVGICLYF